MGLERLQDLLERTSPAPYRVDRDGWNVFSGDRLVANCGAFSTNAYDTGPENRANASLHVLAPVIASDLIALAEAAQVVVDDRTNTGAGDGNVYCRRCDYPIVDGVCGMRAGTRKNDWTCSMNALRAALSTVLAHIDDSLPAPATSLEGDAQ